MSDPQEIEPLEGPCEVCQQITDEWNAEYGAFIHADDCYEQFTLGIATGDPDAEYEL